MAQKTLENEDQRSEAARSYLENAKLCLDRAITLVASAEDQNRLYAALELRRAFEALVYENAVRFLDDLSVADLHAWQPKPLLEKLIAIDPNADQTLEMRVQAADGEWHSLGFDHRISLKALKDNYYALGNHLHMPTIAAVSARKSPSPSSLARLCDECIKVIKKAVSANTRLNKMELHGRTDFTCSGCGNAISRRLDALRTPQNAKPTTLKSILIECHHCPAGYWITSSGPDGELNIHPDEWVQPCPMHECSGHHVKWKKEAVDGMLSTCPKCGISSTLRTAIIFAPEEAFLLQAQN